MNTKSNTNVRDVALKNTSITQKLRELGGQWVQSRENFNKGWKSAEKIEKLNLYTSIIALVTTNLEIQHVLYQTVGGPTLFWAVLPLLVVIAGGATLLAMSFQRVGGLLNEVQTLKAKYENQIADLQEKHEKQMKDLEFDYALKFASEKGERIHRRNCVFQAMHDLAHINRDYITKIFKGAKKLLIREPVIPAYTVGVLVSYCDSISERLNTLFAGHYKFRTCIKVFSSRNEVITIARDRETRKTRPPSSDRNTVCDVEKNTGFLHLRCNDNIVYACDNLLALGNTYRNQTHNWWQRYTATMLVPIRRSAINDSGKFELVGFIGVDCLPHEQGANIFCTSKGVADADDGLRNFLLAYADTAFAIIKRGIVVNPNLSPQNENYVIDEHNFEFVKELHRVFTEEKWQEVTGCYHHA